MLLCPNCHKRIDDLEPERFTVDELLAMKQRHLNHRAEGWDPDPQTLSAVAEDMVGYFLQRIGRAGYGERDDEDGFAGSSGIGYMSETVGPIEARQMAREARNRPFDDSELFDSPLRPARAANGQRGRPRCDE